MPEAVSRLPIPGHGFSVAPGGIWTLVRQPDGVDVTLHDAHLTHEATRCAVSVRRLGRYADFVRPDLFQGFARYADVSWPNAPRVIEAWTHGALRGVTGTFAAALSGATVREWVVTDGRHVANVATFATEAVWVSLLDDCERLARSVRFDASNP